MGMPTGFDLLGKNPALQEHFIKRLIALVVDAVILFVVVFILTLIISFGLFVNWLVSSFFVGILWVAYSTILEASGSGATLGKRIMNLRVVGIDAPMALDKALIRNISKIHGIFLLIDWIIGLATEGDPRQRYLDRIARTTVTRVDQNAYMEEQFRQMQRVPPHPTPPPTAAWGQPPPQPAQPTTEAVQTPPGPTAQAPAGGWPGQSPPPPGAQWPQHQWDEKGQLVPQVRFCSNCGGQLVQRGDGKLVCVRCGAVY